MIEIVKDPAIDDFSKLLELIQTAFAAQEGQIDPPSSATRLTAGNLRKDSLEHTLLLAREEGRLVGCVLCQQQEDSLYLYRLAVDPLAQGKGVGTKLANQVIAEARMQKLVRVTLKVRCALTENQAFFAANGFAIYETGSHPGFDHPTFVRMERMV